MLNDDTHAQYIYKKLTGGLILVCTVSAKCLTVPKLVYKFSIFPCTFFSKCYIIKQLLTNEALDMM